MKKANGKPAVKKAAQQASRHPKEDMAPSELMRSMGGNGWFNPESNDMIRVLRHLAKTHAIPRPIIVMYAWMKWQTLTAENRQPYANRKGIMLYLKDMAEDLGIEICNCRTYWRTGVQLGIWRSGDPTQGENAEGLYLCAVVATVAEAESSKKSSQVCTNLREEFLGKFKPYIREGLEKLPPEAFQQFATRWDRLEALEDWTHADLLAAVRTAVGQNKYDLCRKFGIEKKRLNTTKNKAPDVLAEEQAREARIADILLPHVVRYVQTLDESVPTSDSPVYGVDSKDVQTSPDRASREAISLEQQAVSGGAERTYIPPPTLLDLVSNPQTPSRAGGGSGRSLPRQKQTPSHDGREAGQVHTPQAPPPSAEEAAGVKTWLEQFATLQRENPRKFEGPPVDAENKGDRAWALQIVRRVGLPELEAFRDYVDVCARKNRLGLRVGPGIVLDGWTGDFTRLAPQREQERLQQIEQERKREEFARITAEHLEKQEELERRVDACWEALPVAEQVERLRAGQAAAQKFRSKDWGEMPKEQKRDMSERQAKAALRREIEREKAEGAGGD